MLNVRISAIIVALIYFVDAKVYEKCELARELRDRHFIAMDQIGIYVCIAERQSNLNTEAVGQGLYYGMYQLSSEFWCDVNYAGKACGVHCSSLVDDDIADDLNCVRTIYDEHQRLFNNGFNAWPSSQFCQSQGNYYVQECFDEDNQIINNYEPEFVPAARQEKVSGNVDEGKVYDRCELARELHYQHNIQMDHIATWVCIAKHESGFNTSAIGRLNWDGSEDHGLFQISDIYWCGNDGKACGVSCPQLRDNDISNDVKCIKKIHAEHQRLSGDGFNAWAVYPRCKESSQQYAEGCFDSVENEVLPYRPNPGIQQPTKSQLPKRTYVQTTNQRRKIQKAPEVGKVYERCELAQELRYKYKIPLEQVATWVCIAKHESDFNTSAVGRLNADGSEDHGLFQISDLFWCSPPGHGTGCGVACSKFEDNDITDDVDCMLKIHEEHTFLSGDGFNAWAVYRPHCQGRELGYIDGCFNPDEGDLLPRPAVTQPQRITTDQTTTQLRFTTERSTKTTTVRTTTERSTTPRASTARTTTSRSTTPKTSTTRTTTNKPTTSRITTYRTTPYEPITTTQKLFDTTIIDTTIQPTTSRAASTIKSAATYKTVENSPTTVKSFNIFDLYFNSFSKGSSNNDIKPTQKNVVYKPPTTTKAPSTTTTRAYDGRAINREAKIRNDFNGGTAKTTRRTTLGNPYSESTTRNLKSVSKTSATHIATTTPKSIRDIVRQSTVLQPKIVAQKTPQTKRKTATLKPFNVFAFYLNDYTSKTPINYRPVQFSDRSTVIVKKADNLVDITRATTQSSSTTSSNELNKNNPDTTTRRQQIIKFDLPSTVRPLSVYNAFDDYSFNSNRIGRVAPNITPHSFEYLLKLTTPRTAFN